jgi:hypothetical protein
MRPKSEQIPTCNAMGDTALMCHTGGMATYTVTVQSDPPSFSVKIIGDDGARQTMLGFASERAAEDWIAKDRLRIAPNTGFQTPWRFS